MPFLASTNNPERVRNTIRTPPRALSLSFPLLDLSHSHFRRSLELITSSHLFCRALSLPASLLFLLPLSPSFFCLSLSLSFSLFSLYFFLSISHSPLLLALSLSLSLALNLMSAIHPARVVKSQQKQQQEGGKGQGGKAR